MTCQKERFNPHPKLYGIEAALYKARQELRSNNKRGLLNQVLLIQELADGIVEDTQHSIHQDIIRR